MYKLCIQDFYKGAFYATCVVDVKLYKSLIGCFEYLSINPGPRKLWLILIFFWKCTRRIASTTQLAYYALLINNKQLYCINKEERCILVMIYACITIKHRSSRCINCMVKSRCINLSRLLIIPKMHFRS